MAVYLTIETDAFEEVARSQAEQRRASLSSTSGSIRARRPLRGIEIKEDRVAYIKLIQSDGSEIPLTSSSTEDGTTVNYSNFILQSVQEARMEKTQIIETFGESYIYFFGEAPRFLDVQAILLNTLDFNWEAEWWDNYENYMRGTRSVEHGARLYLFYDDCVVEGYMLNCNATKTADQPYFCQMSFRLFVTNYRNISFIGNTLFPTRAGAANSTTTTSTDPANKDAAATNADRADNDYLVQDDSLLDPWAAQTSLTNTLSSVPTAASLTPATAIAVAQQGTTSVAAVQRTLPLRSSIIDNIDEFIGDPDLGLSTYSQQGIILPRQIRALKNLSENDSLYARILEAVHDFKAIINHPYLINAISMIPGIVSSLASGSSAASYTKKPSSPYSQSVVSSTSSGGLKLTTSAASGSLNTQIRSLTTSTSTSSSAVGSAASTTNSGTTTSSTYAAGYGQQSSSALDIVYGTSTPNSMISSSSVQGGGDREYGYSSVYGSGPGYGKAGFGDFGGNGFGSASGQEGDPGYISPSSFTYRGLNVPATIAQANTAGNTTSAATTSIAPVTSQAALAAAAANAYAKFNTPIANNTIFGSSSDGLQRIPLGASNSGQSGSASITVAGKPTSFSVVALDGTFDFVEGIQADPKGIGTFPATMTPPNVVDGTIYTGVAYPPEASSYRLVTYNFFSLQFNGLTVVA